MRLKILKIKFANLLFAFVLLITPKPIHHGLSFNYLVLWNAGYSNYLSHVSDHKCLHLDPGGTLRFPKSKINMLCALKENSLIFLHLDHFHTKYTKFLKKNTLLKIQTEKSNEEDLELHQKKFGFKYFKMGPIDSFGHLTKTNIESIFLRKTKGRLGDYLILPNHGQPKFLSKEVISKFKAYKMVISGSQSRKYKHHLITEAKFLKNKIPIVYKNVWGHLFFEL